MEKSLILSVALCLSSLSFAGTKSAGTKSYDVTFSSPAKVSGVKLAAGEYKVKVEGANAVFTDRRSKSVTAPVKVENGAKKFPYTTIDASKDGDVDMVNSIELGGSSTTLEFTK